MKGLLLLLLLLLLARLGRRRRAAAHGAPDSCAHLRLPQPRRRLELFSKATDSLQTEICGALSTQLAGGVIKRVSAGMAEQWQSTDLRFIRYLDRTKKF